MTPRDSLDAWTDDAARLPEAALAAPPTAALTAPGAPTTRGGASIPAAPEITAPDSEDEQE